MYFTSEVMYPLHINLYDWAPQKKRTFGGILTNY